MARLLNVLCICAVLYVVRLCCMSLEFWKEQSGRTHPSYCAMYIFRQLTDVCLWRAELIIKIYSSLHKPHELNNTQTHQHTHTLNWKIRAISASTCASARISLWCLLLVDFTHCLLLCMSPAMLRLVLAGWQKSVNRSRLSQVSSCCLQAARCPHSANI